MQPTTTLADVIRRISDIFRGLAPTAVADRKFDRCPPDHDLRAWAEANAGEASLRKFEIARPGDRAEPGIIDAAATRFTRDLEVLIAYPVKVPRLYPNEGGRLELENLIEADAHLLSETLWNADNLPAGVNRMAPEVGATDKTSDAVWFLPLIVHVEWFQSTDNIT